MSKENVLPIWRRILTILLAVVAACLLVYGVILITVQQAFSDQTIERTIQAVDLEKYYGKEMAEAVDVGIMHLTNSAYTDTLYLKAEDLNKVLDEKAIKTFLSKTIKECVHALKKNRQAEITSEELLPLLVGIGRYIQTETGITVTDEMLQKEIEEAIGGHTIMILPKTEFRLASSTWVTIAATTLFLAALLFSWPKLGFSSFVCLIGVFLSFIVLWIVHGVLSSLLDPSYYAMYLGTGIVQQWLLKANALFSRNTWLVLLGMIAPLIILLWFWIYAINVAKWKSRRVAEQSWD